MATIDPPVPFEHTCAECEEWLENAGDNGLAVRHALTRACGVLEGYYRAGAVAKFIYESSCRHLRLIAQQRTAIADLREEAIAQGLGG